MMYELVIVADTNDADYVTEISNINQKNLDEVIKPVAEALKNAKHKHYCNWPNQWHDRTGDPTIKDLYPQLSEELIERFSEYAPSFEGGIHSIESITYYIKPEKIELF